MIFLFLNWITKLYETLNDFEIPLLYYLALKMYKSVVLISIYSYQVTHWLEMYLAI